jgi:hypothetical protein
MTTVKMTNDVPMRVSRTAPSNCHGFTVCSMLAVTDRFHHRDTEVTEVYLCDLCVSVVQSSS